MASGTSAFLSKPAASPTGLGKSSPNADHRQARIVGRGPRQQRRQQPRQRQGGVMGGFGRQLPQQPGAEIEDMRHCHDPSGRAPGLLLI